MALGTAGWVMGVFALIGVVGGIPAGAAVSRFGDRRLIVLGLALIALGSAAGALAGTVSMLLAARVVEGAGLLLIIVAAPAVLDRFAASRDRDLAFGIWGSFMPVGIAMALLIGPLLEGWRPFWLANAGLAVVAAVLVVLLVRRDDQTTERLSWRGVRSEEHTSELQSLMRIPYAVFCLKKKKKSH